MENLEGKRCILVIDDNREAANLLVQMLQICGHDSAAVYNGIDGLVAAARLLPDIILLDLAMPGTNGFEILKILRQTPATQNASVVAFTASYDTATRQRASLAGFDFHLAKPASIGRIMQIISQIRSKRV